MAGFLVLSFVGEGIVCIPHWICYNPSHCLLNTNKFLGIGEDIEISGFSGWRTCQGFFSGSGLYVWSGPDSSLSGADGIQGWADRMREAKS
jgi:hypothetical protein